MAYKKISPFVDANGKKSMYIYLFNNKDQLNDINDRPAFTHYRNGVVIDEQYYKNGKANLNLNKPHRVMFYDSGEIRQIVKKSSIVINNNCWHNIISNVYFDKKGNIIEQIYIDRRDNRYKGECFKTE